MRAKYQNKNCKISLTFIVFVLLFHFVNIWLILNHFDFGVLPFFPQEYICKIIYIFFYYYYGARLSSNAYIQCTSVYVYIIHVLLLTNIDCTWLNIESELFIRPRDYQIKRRNVTMRAKYQNKNCKISLTFTVFVLLFHFVNIWLILNHFDFRVLSFLGEAKDGKISIIVRFLTYRQRHVVFSNKRKLKGNKDKMFIAENLTKYRYDLLRL
jgi:hypothetical protein